jgi:hypothetical protein
VLPCNRPVLAAWMEFAGTQWRAGGMGGRMGLDYTAVMGALQAHRPRTWKRLFAGVRVIERALLSADAESRERADGHPH